MNIIQTIVAYLCQNYPHSSELSKSRLTKLVYLADWYSALIDERQLTNIHWHFNHYGPYVGDVVENIVNSPYFNIEHEYTMYGSDKYRIKFNGYLPEDSVDSRTKQILDAVINNTEKLYYNDFIDYVYSTYPIVARQRYSDLNLVDLARDYKHQLQR
ncbi:TPA: Panacea domain-containing protein [Vibrio cholerae]|uniref:Panacea domain-containing protein n=1 Tax=Vibrio metoecus TaxID=1481663 RepID=UPI000511B5C0|nr:Panacea domain-containing protein [Vibrio metoecus]EJL8259207.1 SocA family protein [Vibrio cholerae]